MALRVDNTWLADVGHGKGFLRPLRWESREDQSDPQGVFRLVDADEGDIDVLMNGRPAYRLERRAAQLSDFVARYWWGQSAPESKFLGVPTCSLATTTGRILMRGNKLYRNDNGQRTVEVIDDLLSAYKEHFGLELEHVNFPQATEAGLLPSPPAA